jgi:hypothetical protein
MWQFLPIWSQNRWSDSWLSLKIKVVEGFPIWASKPAVLVWWFGHQNHHDGFLVWASKPSRLRFVGCTRKTDRGRSTLDTRRDLVACFAWKQVGLEFPNLAWRLEEVRRWVVHVAPSRRLRWSQVEDGPCYSIFTVFNVLGRRGMIVI